MGSGLHSSLFFGKGFLVCPLLFSSTVHHRWMQDGMNGNFAHNESESSNIKHLGLECKVKILRNKSDHMKQEHN